MALVVGAKRIQELTKAFDDATALVEELRSEITEGHLLAERYKADVEQYERLAQLKSAEVEAITRVLKGELRSGERRSILWGLVSNALVGVVSSFSASNSVEREPPAADSLRGRAWVA